MKHYNYSRLPISETLDFSNLLIPQTKSHLYLPSFKRCNFTLEFSNSMISQTKSHLYLPSFKRCNFTIEFSNSMISQTTFRGVGGSKN